MASNFGIVGICGTSMAIVFADNITHGKDPFTPLVAGGVFTAGCVGIGQVEPEFGEAIAWVFLLSNLLLKSDAILNFFLGVSGENTTSQATLHNGVNYSIAQKPLAANPPKVT